MPATHNEAVKKQKKTCYSAAQTTLELKLEVKESETSEHIQCTPKVLEQ